MIVAFWSLEPLQYLLAYVLQIDLEKTGTDFVELIAYCANKCQANPDYCSMFGAHLNKIAANRVYCLCDLV